MSKRKVLITRSTCHRRIGKNLKPTISMKKIFLTGIFTILFLNVSNAQEIEMKINLMGYNFIQEGEKLSWSELLNATTSNKEAYQLIKKAKSQNTLSTITSIIGGVLVGIPLGQSRTEKDPNWTLAYIGGGITIVGIPLSFSAFNNVNKGVDMYNLSLKSASRYQFKPEFKIVASGNGIGLSMNF